MCVGGVIFFFFCAYNTAGMNVLAHISLARLEVRP